MNKLWLFAVCLLLIISCENRRTEDIATSRAPDDAMDRENTDNTNREGKTSAYNNRDDEHDNDIEMFDREKEDRIDKPVANAGKSIFISDCASCHQVEVKDRDGVEKKDKINAGPDLTEITDIRNDRWLVKFMTNSDGNDRTGKLAENICMVQRNGRELNRDQALKVLEYLHLRNVQNNSK
ncbi:MAG TPA: cytochrome c [Chitinophagaceae bacterium]|nr:cytochrome c [Chitinophagaceae bacterium]